MLTTQKIENWAVAHHPAWLDLLRVCVGLFLCRQGLAFLNDIWVLQQVLIEINLNWDAYYVAHIIAYTHIIGGLMITLGLFTRLAIFFQLPILICAIIFMWPGFDYSAINQSASGSIFYIWSGADNSSFSLEWWLALSTFLLLIFCYVFNSGPWSLDRLLRNYGNS